MAKKKVTTRKFSIVDLVRYKPTTKYLTIDTTRIDIQIDVTTTGILSASEVPSAAMDRLEKTARNALDVYETTIRGEVEVLEKKIAGMIETGDPAKVDEAEKLIQGVNQSVKNALASAEGAALYAVRERMKKESQGDKNLMEAQIRLGIKITIGAVSLATQITKLVTTAGADVTAYFSIAKICYGVGKEIYEYCKSEEKLRKELSKAVKDFINVRGAAINQAVERQRLDTAGLNVANPKAVMKDIAAQIASAGSELLMDRSAKEVLSEVMDMVLNSIKSAKENAEAARVAYRNHTVKTRHKVDSLSVEADKLVKRMKSALTLNDGVKIGAMAMAVKRKVAAMAEKLAEREKFLDDMQEILAKGGLSFDDKTTLDKIKELDIMTIYETAKEVYDIASEIQDLVESFV
jgi:hypothetical protein